MIHLFANAIKYIQILMPRITFSIYFYGDEIPCILAYCKDTEYK